MTTVKMPEKLIGPGLEHVLETLRKIRQCPHREPIGADDPAPCQCRHQCGLTKALISMRDCMACDKWRNPNG